MASMNFFLSVNAKLEESPIPHPVVSSQPPSNRKQSDLSLDILFLEGVPCLHVICKASMWSETEALTSGRLSSILNSFKRIQVLRHGAPLTVQADNQFNRADFINYLKDIGSSFVLSAANDHEANGVIESANRVLRMHFRKIRASDHRSPLSDLLAEATYAKNINCGNKLASAFELLTAAILPSLTIIKTRTNLNLVNSTWRLRILLERWTQMDRPCQVVSIINGVVSLIDGENIKTSSLNRVLKTLPPIQALDADDEFDVTTATSERR
eukprot:IDg3112t1